MEKFEPFVCICHWVAKGYYYGLVFAFGILKAKYTPAKTILGPMSSSVITAS